MVPKVATSDAAVLPELTGQGRAYAWKCFSRTSKGKEEEKMPTTSTQKNYTWKMATICEYDCVRFKWECAALKAWALHMITHTNKVTDCLTAYSLFIHCVSVPVVERVLKICTCVQVLLHCWNTTQLQVKVLVPKQYLSKSTKYSSQKLLRVLVTSYNPNSGNVGTFFKFE